MRRDILHMLLSHGEPVGEEFIDTEEKKTLDKNKLCYLFCFMYKALRSNISQSDILNSTWLKHLVTVFT